MQADHNEAYEWARLLGHLTYPIVALTLAGIGVGIRMLPENTGKDWPTVEGQVQFVNVRVGEGRDNLKHAVITYSYFLNQYESGEYVRSFVREQSAWDFADAFKGKKVTVHYNPRRPGTSTLLKEELERLLPIKNENSFTR